MKQSIQLRLGQHLTMTPQLQQAIRLLQLSTLELQTEIQQILESNLMLETAENETADDTAQSDAETPEAQDASAATENSESATDEQNDNIPDELALDTAWEDTYDMGITPHTSAPAGDGDNRDYLESLNFEEESLQDHLTWQMELTPFSDTDRAIALAIIDSINDDGYLNTTVDDIHQGLSGALDIELDEVEAVLHRIQQFDPVGVAARDLRECLIIQLRHLDPDTPDLDLATEAVGQHLDLLANRDYNQVMRRLKIPENRLQDVIGLIQSLNPRPGSQIASSKAQYIAPDVFVSKRNGKWHVELNPESAPRIRINSQYAGMVRRADNSDDNQYLRNHLQEARWFLKSLQSRNETLLKVARCIVDRQQDALELGEEHMKPLVLRDVAETVEMHESTISRVTTQKFMHTPKGIFEFKHFFSSHVGTADGGECSATAIRAMIRKLVAAEVPAKPLSDSKIANILSDKGINVARRTIAKYREAMAIPPSNERKRLA